MIACQLYEPLSRTIEVGSAIANVGYKDFWTHNQSCCDCRCHRGPGELLVAQVDNIVGPLHTMPEQFIPRGTSLCLSHLWEDRVHNGLDGQAACLLTISLASKTICHYKQTEGFLCSSNGPLGSKNKILVGFAPFPFASIKPYSCRELDGEIGRWKGWWLTSESWGHQLQGVSKQKLRVLWLVDRQGQLQISKVCL